MAEYHFQDAGEKEDGVEGDVWSVAHGDSLVGLECP